MVHAYDATFCIALQNSPAAQSPNAPDPQITAPAADFNVGHCHAIKGQARWRVARLAREWGGAGGGSPHGKHVLGRDLVSGVPVSDAAQGTGVQNFEGQRDVCLQLGALPILLDLRVPGLHRKRRVVIAAVLGKKRGQQMFVAGLPRLFVVAHEALNQHLDLSEKNRSSFVSLLRATMVGLLRLIGVSPPPDYPHQQVQARRKDSHAARQHGKGTQEDGTSRRRGNGDGAGIMCNGGSNRSRSGAP